MHLRGTEYKARDKTVQKITRDGLIEQNLTEGTQKSISIRPRETSFSKGSTSVKSITKGKPPSAPGADAKKHQRTKQAAKIFQESNRVGTSSSRSAAPVSRSDGSGVPSTGEKKSKRRRKKPEAKTNNSQQITSRASQPMQSEKINLEQHSDVPSIQAEYKPVNQINKKEIVITQRPARVSSPARHPEPTDNSIKRKKEALNTTDRRKEPLHTASRRKESLHTTDRRKESLHTTGRRKESLHTNKIHDKTHESKITRTQSFNKAYAVRFEKKSREALNRARAAPVSAKDTSLPKVRGSLKSNHTVKLLKTDTARYIPLTDKQATQLSQLRHKAEKHDTKVSKVHSRLPTHRAIRYTRTIDKNTGKIEGRLRFQKEVRPLRRDTLLDRSSNLVFRTSTAMQNTQDESKQDYGGNDNIGTEAMDKTARTSRTVVRHVRNFRHHMQARAFRRVAKLERRAVNAHANYLYKKDFAQNPGLRNSNPIKKYLQKRAIKRRYAQAYRASKTGANAVQQGGNIIIKVARTASKIIFRNKTILGMLTGLLIVYVVGALLFASCSAIVSNFTTIMITTTYSTDDYEIHDTDLQWTEMEQNLREQIDDIETEYPDYDEYRYNVDSGAIDHNPFELIAFLSSLYNDFKYTDISSVLTELFMEQYELILDEETEIRSRTETYIDENGDEQTEEVEYEYRILDITLESKTFIEVVTPILEENGAMEQFNVYMESLGNHQAFGSPFSINWLDNVSSLYGYRQNPTGPGTQFHKGIDIALPGGTPIHAVQDGRIITATHSSTGYGNHIVIEDDNGVRSVYAHCNELLVSVGQLVKRGDIIATVGTTGDSTGNHLHIEILINGQNLNPLFLLGNGIG